LENSDKGNKKKLEDKYQDIASSLKQYNTENDLLIWLTGLFCLKLNVATRSAKNQ